MELTSKPDRIPLHLIAGPLGVGKTTAIRRFVAQSSGYTAVLVNDFGETGYDAAFIEEAGGSGVRVENVPGGCLCCTSAAQMLPALGQLSNMSEVERIIVEPSGIALLDPLLKMLRTASVEYGLELMPVMVLFDPAKIRPTAIQLIPYWRQLMDYADIVVLNRCDQATEQAVLDFFQCLENLDTPKLKAVQTSYGDLPQELFDLRGGAVREAPAVHAHAELPPAGTFRSDQRFKLNSLLAFLETVAPQLDRFKGVFHTDAGWMRLEIASGQIVCNPAQPAGRSAADWIGTGNIGDSLAAARLS